MTARAFALAECRDSFALAPAPLLTGGVHRIMVQWKFLKDTSFVSEWHTFVKWVVLNEQVLNPLRCSSLSKAFSLFCGGIWRMWIMNFDFTWLQLFKSLPQRRHQVWLLSTSMLIWYAHRYWQQPPQLWGGNDRPVAPVGRMDRDWVPPRSWGLPGFLALCSSILRQTLPKNYKQIRLEIQRTKALSPLSASTARNPRLTLSEPQFNTIQKYWLRSPELADSVCFITQIWR